MIKSSQWWQWRIHNFFKNWTRKEGCWAMCTFVGPVSPQLHGSTEVRSDFSTHLFKGHLQMWQKLHPTVFFPLLAKASSLLGSGWHYLALQSFHSVAFLLMFAALDTQPATIYVGWKISYLIFLTVTVSTITVCQLPLACRNGVYWCILYNVQ